MFLRLNKISDKFFLGVFMQNVKKSSVDGMFYPKTKEEIIELLDSFKKNLKPQKAFSRALIVPHAGYIFSGELALFGLSHLDCDVENIFIFAPAHRCFVQEAVISSYDAFSVPLGEIEQNKDILNELNKNFNIEYNNDAFDNEHAIEVELPILQYLKKDKPFKIIPLLMGLEGIEKIKEIISYYYPDKKNAFIISSDLSHFHTLEDAKKIDETTALMIEENNIKSFHHQRACNAGGIFALMKFAKENSYSLIRLSLSDSSKGNGDKKRVVGYGSWMLVESMKNDFIKKYYSDFILDVCRKVIINKGKYFPKNYDAVFDEKGACFVTLEIEGFLRGCIGSIIAWEPLIDNLVKNAYNAAYKDSRFMPLDENEINKIDIKFSLLSHLEKIEFENEEDLLNKIVPFKDGIVIKDGVYQGVYLPSVWEELSDKKIFLNSLKKKAGLAENHFSNTFEAYRFEVSYIQ